MSFIGNALPVSLLVAVSVTLTPTGAQTPNFNTAMVMGSSATAGAPVIDVVTRMRTYATLAAVGVDFGNTAPEYLAATEWFAQLPQPTSLNIGFWAQSATSGQLYGGAVSAANQAIAVWNAITTGSFHVSINGVANDITGMSFSLSANLNAVAAVIQAAIRAIGTGGYTLATCVWNPAFSRFVITSDTTGTASTVSFLTAAGSGADISVILAMRNTAGNGAYVANGIAAETALSAVTTLDVQFGGLWYGLATLGVADADVQAIAPYVEAASIAPHYYGVNTQEAGVITTGDTSNIAYLLKATGYNHTAVQYSSSSLYAVVSMLARILTTNWSGQDTAITLMFKQEPGITAETLNTTQIAALQSTNANVFVNYSNGIPIIQNGTSTTGVFIDSVMGIDVLAATIQTGLFNAMYQTPTKIPQTDAGMHILATSISGSCQQFVNNGLLGPGTWTAPGFGQLVQNQFLGAGFYVYQPPIANQSASARSARASVPFQVAAKLAGAVQNVNVAISVNS
jgi:hypothetical protein